MLRRVLREPDKTLDDLLTMGRALKMADAKASTMERNSVNKVHTTEPRGIQTKYKTTQP